MRHGSFDVLVDENLLDGLACSAKGLTSLREAGEAPFTYRVKHSCGAEVYITCTL